MNAKGVIDVTTTVEVQEVVQQDVEMTDLSSLVDDLYADDQVERPGVACEITF